MKWKNIFLSISVLIFFVSSCTNQSNPTITQEELFFDLTFSHENTESYNTILVTFTTNDWDSNPSIVVNGYKMDRENFVYPEIDGSGRNLFGQKVIPYSKSCDYNISVEGKSTTGSIDMPSVPYNIFCNEVELKENSYTNLDFSDSLNFSWKCDSSDGYLCYLSSNEYYKGLGPKGEAITFLVVDPTNYTFVVKAVNSSHLNVDLKPNILKYYNDATISSETYFKRYNIGFNK